MNAATGMPVAARVHRRGLAATAAAIPETAAAEYEQ